MYINAIYYGNGYWGDEQAARGYFDISPYDLSWGEAAMLAGLPKPPRPTTPCGIWPSPSSASGRCSPSLSRRTY